ncbi:MAG: VTT domain-containing protein [Alphaproteobacteria bacterium]|nr:VTT domain-containing protein [Alphaproteobacteria bacterium]
MNRQQTTVRDRERLDAYLSPDTADVAEQSMRRLVVQLGIGLVVVVGIVGALAWFLRDPLTAVSQTFVARFGLKGVFTGVLLTDTFALTHEPLLLAAHAGGLAFWPVFATASVASVTAGPVGWLLGAILGRAAFVQRMFARYRIDSFLHRYGVWAIAVAAITPFPYSVATWASGAAGVSFKTVMLGSLFRVPKVLFYFLLIVGSWGLGVSL